MSNNGPFGALAEGLQAGFGMRQAYKQRKLDEEMDRLNREDRTKKAALDAEMQRQGMEARLREITNGENATKWQQDQAAKEFAARQDAAFSGASPQAQQMMLKGNQPVGVGIFAPGAGPADVQRFQERMPLVQERLGQEQEDRARGIQMQEQAQRDTQSRLAAQMLKNFGAGAHKPTMGWTQTTSTDENGDPVVTRMPVMPGQMPAGPEPKAPENPELAAVNAAIAAQQKRIGDARVRQAEQGNRTFPWLTSRESDIADAQQKIANLHRAMPGALAGAALPLGVAPAAQAPALSPQDQQMRAWAQANPNNPRAQMILQKLGQR